MSGKFYWDGREIPFMKGESVASALMRAGIRSFGRAASGLERCVFCSIGQCQNCLVVVDGRLTEGCLLECSDGMLLSPYGYAHD